ncbi:biotin transporter BioY [Pseudokineococcus lusitanus]|uniref:Biotin transporter n=1 Tax=Pseudokineococcus lusitanus TaxID=763993 RepID=A0A3N1G8H2_9ACTN|nr:biotin transporter BioY [Pseudokineococcus lusitanus]ROP26526.1 biotin transport system substrate-specific component [Pseudokineococcus lusitanus]
MSSASASSTAPLPRPGEVLADLLPASRVREVALVAAGVAVMALLAQVVVPVPGSPVPITGQTLGLVLVATTLGPARSVTVMGLYIAAALVGLPFYSEASGGYEVVVGATGGYVLGFLPAAYLIGRAARLGADRHFLKALPLFVAGQLVVFAVGVPWLALTTGMDAAAAVAAGFTPFLLGGAVKAFVAAAVVPGIWRTLGR